jgi:hypothetical protein
LWLLILLIACKKEKQISSSPSPIAQPPVVLLKEITIPNLPSPYYHFEYDNTGKVSFASFASDFFRYDVFYAGGRISKMKNNILVNKDELQYFYNSAGKIEGINYTDSTGVVYARMDLFYQGDKLIKLDRVRRSGTGFVYEKSTTMSYYDDGNLMDLTVHYLPFNGQTEATFTSHFEQYDKKINVDGFSLIKGDEFFDHLFLLPGVQLQKNNPGKETRTGDGVNYTVNYTYTYNEDFPINKKGNLVVTNGQNPGQIFETNSFFSYY